MGKYIKFEKICLEITILLLILSLISIFINTSRRMYIII